MIFIGDDWYRRARPPSAGRTTVRAAGPTASGEQRVRATTRPPSASSPSRTARSQIWRPSLAAHFEQHPDADIYLILEMLSVSADINARSTL